MENQRNKKRTIGKIEIKGNSVIKGIQYEGNRVVGKSSEILEKFASYDFDEILIEDTIASYYGMKSNLNFVKEFNGYLPPLTIGGGIKNIKDAENIFKFGADKICINTFLFENINLISDLISVFGAQAITVSIQLISNKNGTQLRRFYGREIVKKINFIEWLNKIIEYSPGEIIINNVSRDGTLKGIDYELIKKLPHTQSTRILYGGGIRFKELNNDLFKKFNNIDGYVISKDFYEYSKQKKLLSKNKESFTSLNIIKIRSSIKNKIAIINVGTGNIGRLINSLSKLNYNVTIITENSEIPEEAILCIPGVGHFGNVMDKFLKIGLNKKLTKYLKDKRPLLAICLGMQILCKSSEEVREKNNKNLYEGKPKNLLTQNGLGFIEGIVTKLPAGIDPLPNIGYKETTDLKTLEKNQYYYIHSYALKIKDLNESEKQNINEISTFNNTEFVAYYHSKNISAFQYHPEISGPQGIRKLKTSLENLTKLI